MNLGCNHLLGELWRVKPRLHVFGHVHEGYGLEWLQFDGLQRAFEGVIMTGGGLMRLVDVASEILQNFMRPAAEANCLLVNPAMVGGLWDKERRKPIKVVV